MAEIRLPFRTLEWKDGQLILLDQKVLPNSVNYIEYDSYRDVIEAIKTLTVRGAPAIGVAAGYAVVLASREFRIQDKTEYLKSLRKATEEIIAARPTAVNLRWAVERMMRIVEQHEGDSIEIIHCKIEKEAGEIEHEDIRLCKMIGENGAKLIADGDGVLTHCNAGALATAGIGTALGVIYTADSKGKEMKIFAGETRPLNQGKRITAWELAAAGLDVTLLCDNMVASLMSTGKVRKVIVGADRIAMNGDTANKVGTFNIALIAKHFNVPFYVAAPYSTFDPDTETGEKIPIEYRSSDEITDKKSYAGVNSDIEIHNPAFDITPSEFVTLFITDRGNFAPEEIKGVFG